MHVLIPVLHRPLMPTGVCRHAVNLARCLADIDTVSQITMIIGKWQKNYFQSSFNLESTKIKLVDLDLKNTSLSRNLWFLFGLPKIAQQLQPDLIHMSFPFPFVRNWFPAPVVSTIHDLYPYECPQNFGFPQVWFNQAFLKQCVQNSDGLLCISHCTLQALESYFAQIIPHKKTAVVYNYVDFSEIVPQPVEKSPSISAANFILSVAQHRKNKNLDYLIQAYKLLLDRNAIDKSSRLVIVGSDGPETENLVELICSLSLDDRVIMLSSLNDEELCWLYQNCRLFVIPSSTEGFCLPLVEALTLGSRVVCSDIPILREVGESSQCYFFSLENDPIDNLTQKMELAFNHPIQSSSSPLQKFSKDTIAHQYIDFYRSLL